MLEIITESIKIVDTEADIKEKLAYMNELKQMFLIHSDGDMIGQINAKISELTDKLTELQSRNRIEESFDDDDAFFETYGWIDGESLEEAEYQGRKVKLGKPMQGDVKKFKVYVKNPKGNVVKVNFGHGGSSVKGKAMKIRKNNPKARKSFRARHNCDSPGPRHKARYWSCRAW